MEPGEITILLVDDEADILEFLGYNLEKEGYRVLKAKNGKKALKLAQEHRPHLVILDLMMPVMDGMQTCNEIRKIPELAGTLVAFLTARGEDYSQIAGFEAGADDYITKPIKPKLFVSRVQALLRRYKDTPSSSALIPLKGFTIDKDRYLVVKEGEEIITLEFLKGQLRGVNGKTHRNPVDSINEVERLGAAWAIGRDMHIGDTIIGIKGRVGFEAAAPMLIIKAHQMLEKHTLTKWQQYWKEQLGNWYGMFLHEAMYLEPVMRDIEKFLENSQENVTGKVIINLRPYHFQLIGIESEHDLMNSEFGQYGEMNKGWTAEDAKGFTKILANQLKIYYSVNKK